MEQSDPIACFSRSLQPILSSNFLNKSSHQSGKCHITVFWVITGFLLLSYLLSFARQCFWLASLECVCVCPCSLHQQFPPSPSNTSRSSLSCVHVSPLMVASLGGHPIREAPLRTRGTRGLPESGMPHCRTLIHQVWRSHCNITKHGFCCSFFSKITFELFLMI